MFKYWIVLLLFTVCSDVILNAQKIPPQGYFRYPLLQPHSLSGSFGELRNNHFHSGIDFSGRGKEGQKIFAIADGYVSRVLVSPRGYGKAVYITHPNGYVSVYAHLKEFSSEISQYVKDEQYANQTFYLNSYLDPHTIQVLKGEVIGFLGNTGNSTGPHLHFEIREEISERTLNPALFGITISDTKPPVIEAIRIIPMDRSALINGKNNPLNLKVRLKDGKYELVSPNIPVVAGRIALGIKTHDFNNTSTLRNGVYKLSLYADSLLCYQHVMDSFSFDDTRYINDLIDYQEFKAGNGRFMLTRVSPGNKADIYKVLVNRGIHNINKAAKYKFEFRVEDYAGNVAKLNFILQGDIAATSAQNNNKCEHLLRFDEDFYFRNKVVELSIPAFALYDSICFSYKSTAAPAWAFSAIHSIHKDVVPLHTHYQLTVKPDKLPEALIDKALLVSISSSGKISAAGGSFQNGFVRANLLSFGDYAIAVDTIPPKISPVNISKGKDVSGQKSVMLKITDNLSGIKTYNAYINNVWVLIEYDEKKEMLTYNFDENLLPGISTFVLKVTDKCDNISEYTADIMY